MCSIGLDDVSNILSCVICVSCGFGTLVCFWPSLVVVVGFVVVLGCNINKNELKTCTYVLHLVCLMHVVKTKSFT